MSMQTEIDLDTYPGGPGEKGIIGKRERASIIAHLEEHGYVVLDSLLNEKLCSEISRWYDEPDRFRRRVDMARYRFGKGSYVYFRQPLPTLIDDLRHELYQLLRPVAQRWYNTCKIPFDFPDNYSQFQALCRRAGQTEPAVLMLEYAAGDYNYLHQDLYGECIFPIQMNIQLNRPGEDFEGGEFVITDQHPRRQSKVQVIPLQQGDATLFATSIRPVKSKTGYYRATLKHGVSALSDGRRRALGIILHNAPN